ncbi:MAG: transposase [Candidatus Saccharimonadales bacterium]
MGYLGCTSRSNQRKSSSLNSRPRANLRNDRSLVFIFRCPRRRRGYLNSYLFSFIFYVLRATCAWHLLPSDFPPRQTVYFRFQLWQKNAF